MSTAPSAATDGPCPVATTATGRPRPAANRTACSTSAALAARSTRAGEPEALSGAELGHRAAVTAQSMSTAITSLLERGLVARAPSATHGRVLDVRITSAGMELLERAQAATKAVEDRALAPLTPGQQRELRDILRQMMISMDIYLPGSADAR